MKKIIQYLLSHQPKFSKIDLSIYYLPLFHWQYARADEVDKLRQDYQDGINTLKMFMDATNEKMTAPVQVSFLNVRAFSQDVEVNSLSLMLN